MFYLGDISQNRFQRLVSVSDGPPVVDHEDGKAHLEEHLGANLIVCRAHLGPTLKNFLRP